VKGEILFTAWSYAELAAKVRIIIGYSARRRPIGYLKTVGEDSSGQLTFCHSGEHY
jgi:hypothetical protein